MMLYAVCADIPSCLVALVVASRATSRSCTLVSERNIQGRVQDEGGAEPNTHKHLSHAHPCLVETPIQFELTPAGSKLNCIDPDFYSLLSLESDGLGFRNASIVQKVMSS